MKLYKGKPIKYVIEEFARENNLKVVMHFPHSSLGVPDSFWKDVVIDQTSFTKINFLMSDLLLLELFEFWNYEKVIAPYSRLYVDVEKYWNRIGVGFGVKYNFLYTSILKHENKQKNILTAFFSFKYRY